MKIDKIYFQATSGGVCFGGDEPTMYADFIIEFRRLSSDLWKIIIETSLYNNMKGKDKCQLLKAIRRQLAEQYGLEYHPTECHHKGECVGTCTR